MIGIVVICLSLKHYISVSLVMVFISKNIKKVVEYVKKKERNNQKLDLLSQMNEFMIYNLFVVL